MSAPHDLPMKVVGKRRTDFTSIAEANQLLKTAWALRGPLPLAPRGVYRFESFEEADEWMLRMMVSESARRPSRISPRSRVGSTAKEPGTS